MKVWLPNEVMSKKLAPLLMRLADKSNQAITVTAEGILLMGPLVARIGKKIESLEEHTVEVSTWAA